jgi:cell wall-associated NlpC family hydrolase
MTLRKDTPFGELAAYVEGVETLLTSAETTIKQLTEANEQLAELVPPTWEQKADKVLLIASALDALAIPYVFGGETRNGMDCSGFTQFLFKQVGYNLPRVSDDQSKIGAEVKYEDLRAGDLIFYDFNHDGKITHVSICMGGGKMIHTNTPATGINIQSTYWNYDSIAVIRRILS